MVRPRTRCTIAAEKPNFHPGPCWSASADIGKFMDVLLDVGHGTLKIQTISEATKMAIAHSWE